MERISWFSDQLLKEKVKEKDSYVEDTSDILRNFMEVNDENSSVPDSTANIGDNENIYNEVDIKEAALELDSILWGLLQHCTKLLMPIREEGLGVECVLKLPGRTRLQDRGFQKWLVH